MRQRLRTRRDGILAIGRVFLRQCGGCEVYASWFDIQRGGSKGEGDALAAQNNKKRLEAAARVTKEAIEDFRTGKARKAGSE